MIMSAFTVSGRSSTGNNVILYKVFQFTLITMQSPFALCKFVHRFPLFTLALVNPVFVYLSNSSNPLQRRSTGI